MNEKIGIISLLVMFVWHCFQPGEVLGRLGAWIEYRLGDFYSKPVAGCSVCMCPWWGSLFYWVIWGASAGEWVIVVAAAAGMNAVLVRLWPDK